jgi:hypothetical protein
MFRIIFLCFFLSNTIQLFGQQKIVSPDTTIKATTIEISQVYQPQIKQATKQKLNPILPPLDSTKPIFEYQVPPEIQNYTYKPLPIQPIAINKDSNIGSFKHYIKAGLGNLNTINIDAGLTEVKIGNLNSTIHFGLLHQKGELAYQQQTIGVLNSITEGNNQKANYSIGLDASYHQFYQYGFDQKAFPNQIANKQVLSGAQLSGNFNEKKYDLKGFRKIANVAFSFYNGSDINSETALQGNLGIEKKAGENFIGYLGFEGNSTFFNANNYSVTNAYGSLKMGARYERKNLQFSAYLLPTLAQNNNIYLLNDILLKLRIPKAKTIVNFGVKSSIFQNTYRQLYLINPFLSQYTANQTKNTEFFTNIEKAVGQHVTLNARISFWQYSNFATFINAPLTNTERLLVNYIPNVNALSTQLGIRYQIGSSLSTGTQLIIFNYQNLATNTKVWHSPTTRLNADLNWQILAELNFNAYAALVAGNYAQDKNQNPILLKSYVDMGFGFDYVPVKKLSFFLNFNNLLNTKYERWQAYQAYGINIYGGVRLKF